MMAFAWLSRRLWMSSVRSRARPGDLSRHLPQAGKALVARCHPVSPVIRYQCRWPRCCASAQWLERCWRWVRSSLIMFMDKGPGPFALKGLPSARPTMCAAAGHSEFRVPQGPRPKSRENGIDFAAVVGQDAYVSPLKGLLQTLRDGPANQGFDSKFPERLNDSVRLFFKQRDFLAFQFFVAFQPNQQQPRRHVKDWRDTAVAVRDCNQHAPFNASFMPARIVVERTAGFPSRRPRLLCLRRTGGGWSVAICNSQPGEESHYASLSFLIWFTCRHSGPSC